MGYIVNHSFGFFQLLFFLKSIFDLFDGAQAPSFGMGKKVPLRVNPEPNSLQAGESKG
jgi:hypothetical protein